MQPTSGPPGGIDTDVGEPERKHSYLTGPTVQTLAAFGVVFLISQPLAFLFEGLFVGLFALTAPITLNPWALLTSVYAHFDLTHLLANSVALLLFGLLFERMVKPWAYHVFFVVTGAVAGVANVWAASALGSPVAVIGGSGAIFGVLGYVLAANSISQETVDVLRLSSGAQLLVGLVLAGVVTLLTAAPGVALTAHFVGFLVGLVAGRLELLPSRRSRSRPDPIA